MKKVILGSLFAIVATIGVVSCNKDEIKNSNDSKTTTLNEKQVVNFFTSSNEFNVISKNLEVYGEIKIENYKFKRKEINNEIIDIIVFEVLKNNQNNGYLQVIIGSDREIYNQYAQIDAYNESKNEGIVVFHDMEKNSKSLTVEVEDNVMKSYTINDNDLKEKLIAMDKLAPRGTDPLDRNKNGDVTFSECYQTVFDAIEADGFSSWVCDFPALGWAGCWTSVSGACLYWSATH